MKDTIIAWLNGAEIEWKTHYIKGKWRPLLKYTEGAQVFFGAENLYRIKPKEPDYEKMYNDFFLDHTRTEAIAAVVSAAKQWQKEHGSV